MDDETFQKIMDEEFTDENEDANYSVIQTLTTKLVTKDQQNICAICIKQYRKGEHLFQLQCSHHFHTDCMEPWLRKNA